MGLRVFACLLAFASVVLLAVLKQGGTRSSALSFTVAIAVVALANWPFAELRLGSSKLELSANTAGLLLSLVLLPLRTVVLMHVVVALIDNVRVRRSPLKAAYQFGSEAALPAVAGLICSTVDAPGHVTSTAGLAVLALGCITAALTSELALSWVLASAQATPFTVVVAYGFRAKLINIGLEVLLALGAVELARHSPLTLLALPVVAALLVSVHRSNVRRDKEDDVWRQLEAAGREIKQLTEGDIVPVAVKRAATLLRADRVELTLLNDAESGALAYHGTRKGLVGVPVPVDAPYPVEHDAIDLVPDVIDGNTTLDVGLLGADSSLGVLRIVFAGEVEVADRERQVLANYARNLGATITNARLYADAVREAELKAWLAHHDNLTGLLNRPGLLALSDEIAYSVEETSERYAVLVLDMDHFKEVNDTLGHDSGDRLLQHISASLAQRVRRQDVAARLEGDRFAVLLRHLRSDTSVEEIVADILRVIAEPLDFDDMRLSLECSVGYAVAPVDGDSIEELLTRADIATGQAKQSPGSSRRWRAEPDNARTRLALSADMREALAAGEQLLLHYQPKIDVRSGQVTSCEALARWEHPERGMLRPDDFIPIAEQSGLARPFTLAVVDGAVKEAAAWRAMGMGGGEITVAVNLSARNLLDRSLPDDITRICARHGLPTRLLVLEITESVVVSELEVVTDVLARLRQVGLQISVDDFGTGYSSLKFLQAIRVNELKVDKSFVSSMLESPGDAAIVSATIDLGHRLGLRVVAEGVETEAQLEALTNAHCDLVQGYLLAKPMGAADIREVFLPDSGVVVPLRPGRRRSAG